MGMFDGIEEIMTTSLAKSIDKTYVNPENDFDYLGEYYGAPEDLRVFFGAPRPLDTEKTLSILTWALYIATLGPIFYPIKNVFKLPEVMLRFLTRVVKKLGRNLDAIDEMNLTFWHKLGRGIVTGLYILLFISQEILRTVTSPIIAYKERSEVHPFFGYLSMMISSFFLLNMVPSLLTQIAVPFLPSLGLAAFVPFAPTFFMVLVLVECIAYAGKVICESKLKSEVEPGAGANNGSIPGVHRETQNNRTSNPFPGRGQTIGTEGAKRSADFSLMDHFRKKSTGLEDAPDSDSEHGNGEVNNSI